LESILEAAGVTKDDFDLEITEGDATTPQDWFASCGTAPFLSERRITVVRRLFRCDVDRLKGVDFGALPETALLILVGDDEGGGDDRIQRIKTSIRPKWAKAVTAAKGLVCTFDPDPNSARGEIKEMVAKAQKTLSDRASDTLLEMTGANLGRSLDELEKLILFVGTRSQITETDVRTLVVPSRDWNVYKMVDSIVAGAVPEALRQLQILVGSNTKAEDAAFSRILPSVSRQLKLLWQGRLCVDAGCSPSSPSPDVASMLLDRPNLSAEPPYRQSSVMQSARKTSLRQLRACFTILSDTDARIKGALDSYDTMDTLERMVLEMSEVLSGRGSKV
jgi:DNA polymerase-3 subunit delta